MENSNETLSTIYLPVGMKHTRISPSRGRPRAFDAEKALHRAMKVFWRKGYLGTSLSDLTNAMGINRPSLYAAFGDKKSLFRKALERYGNGPSGYVGEALREPRARAVAERLLQGVVELLSGPQSPRTCMWVRGALSCGDDPLVEEFAAQRAAGLGQLRTRLKRAIAEGDLPAGSDPDALALYLATAVYGLTVQASTGATREELLKVVPIVLKAWPR